MIKQDPQSIFSILRESPFFVELSMKERESIITELLWAYPELVDYVHNDDDLGYEASWYMRQNY